MSDVEDHQRNPASTLVAQWWVAMYCRLKRKCSAGTVAGTVHVIPRTAEDLVTKELVRGANVDWINCARGTSVSLLKSRLTWFPLCFFSLRQVFWVSRPPYLCLQMRFGGIRHAPAQDRQR